MADTDIDRNRLWWRLERAVDALRAGGEEPTTPMMVVDLDTFDANAARLAARAAGTPIRLASKSVRVPELLRRALAVDGFAGVLCYTLAEALWLEEQSISDDLVLAYPTVDRAALRRLVASPRAASRITLMVDSLDHLEVVDSIRSSRSVPIRVALDIDAGLHAAGQHVGPKRSPLRDAEQVAVLAAAIKARPGFRLAGVMTYEGQVAGVPDAVPGQGPMNAAVRAIKKRSISQLGPRRDAVAHAVLSAIAPDDLEFFNAGGTGSIETSAADPRVTEVAAGSGLLVPGLFDHYRSFDAAPAAFFGLPVTRRPTSAIATVHGGGLIASGAAGSDRLPIPWLPVGLELTGLEGAGEVQTPLSGSAAPDLKIGDLVWFRHAKSGELFEHTDRTWLLSGEELVDRVETYRGVGLNT